MPSMSRHSGVKTVWLTSKERFRRHGLKSFSYRYEVTGATGPHDKPILERGSGIIETRYRGRSATWSVARSMMDTEQYAVDGTFLEPSPDNPFTYPPRDVPPAAAPAVAAVPPPVARTLGPIPATKS